MGVTKKKKNEFPLSCVYFNLNLAEDTVKVITRLAVDLQYCSPYFFSDCNSIQCDFNSNSYPTIFNIRIV